MKEHNQPMQLSLHTDIRLFNDAQLERILQKALQILRTTPFRIQGTDEFSDYLTSYGCIVDGESVRFPQSVIDKVLARCDEEKRNTSTAEPGTPEEVTAFTHGQALHICDTETNRLRSATEQDLAQWCHVVDGLGISFRSHPTFIPADVPLETADFHAFATILLNSLQPHRVSIFNPALLPFFIDACTIAKGSLDEVKKDPVFGTKTWVTSPFLLQRENIELGMEARRRLGAPLTFGQMSVAGASAPLGVAAALVQNTAESLALSAIRLAVENLPHRITSVGAVMDMKHGFPRQSGPDLFLHQLAGQEMDDYLYWDHRTPHRFHWMGTAAATVSTQSVCEKFTGMAIAAMTGVRKIAVGSLAFADVGSPVHLMLDLEMVGMIRHLFREVSDDDEHIGLDEILSTIPTGGRYMEAENTSLFFREETWLPSLMDCRAYMSWAQNPSDMIADARQKTREQYAQAQNRCPLSDEQRSAIQALVREADTLVKTRT